MTGLDNPSLPIGLFLLFFLFLFTTPLGKAKSGLWAEVSAVGKNVEPRARGTSGGHSRTP